MRRIRAEVTLDVRGPVITRSSSIGAYGIDAPMAQRRFCDPVTGGARQCFYLPGRLVKGLLREAWQEISTLDASYGSLIPQWLGEESPSESDDAPKRGRLLFSDFADYDSDATEQARQRYRIQVDETSGAADAQKLQVMESPYAAGQIVKFRGEVRFAVAEAEDVEPLLDSLHRGLLWIRAVGGARTSGFGEVVGAGLERPAPEATEPQPALGEKAVELRLTFCEPVILSRRRIADNFFDSGDIIPGAALKGALAEMMQRDQGAFQELRNELHLLRFTHAFPAVSGGKRPHQWPLSLLALGPVALSTRSGSGIR